MNIWQWLGIICGIIYFIIFIVSYIFTIKELYRNNAKWWKYLIYPSIFGCCYVLILLLFTPLLIFIFPSWLFTELCKIKKS